MKSICTYCSESKDLNEELIPAFKRYLSPRIILVKEIAEKENIHYCILSGEFGLVDWNQPIPWYSHLLIHEEVPNMVDKVVNQIQIKKISEIDFYTRSPDFDSRIIPYLETIKKAIQLAAIKLRIVSLEEQ